MEVILVHPEIPQNAGNVARTCSVTNTTLTLVRPLGFNISSRHLKRAGLDYWDELDLQTIDSLEDYLRNREGIPFYFFSTKAKKSYTEIPFTKNSILIFGSETSGLPLHMHEQWGENFYTIPMKIGVRSLNLSNSVAIVLYDAWRQLGFQFCE